jgi:hypothetical protein
MQRSTDRDVQLPLPRLPARERWHFVTVALVHESSVRLTNGKAKYHRTIGDGSRWTDRGFCSACGTPLFEG